MKLAPVVPIDRGQLLKMAREPGPVGQFTRRLLAQERQAQAAVYPRARTDVSVATPVAWRRPCLFDPRDFGGAA